MESRFRSITRRGLLAAGLALGLGLAAPTFDASAQTDDARVRITHASPDAPSVDIWVNGEPAVIDLAFGETTGIIPLPAGTYDIDVTPTGSTDPDIDAVISASLSLEAGVGYEVAAVGYVSEIGAQIYSLDLSPLTEGNTRVQIIHASPDAPAVDIIVNGGAAVEGLTFPDASGYLEIPGGSYDIQVAVSETGDIALDLGAVTFEAGQVYAVFAIGQVGDGSLTVLPLGAAADTAAGGESAAAEAAGAGGTGEAAHTVPATGVGSMSDTSASMFGLFAAAAALGAAGVALRLRTPAVARHR